MPRKGKKKQTAARKRVAAVKAIPDGFGTITPYLIVNDGKGAIEFYKRAFGAKELTRSLTPDGKVMNAQIKVGDSIIMIADEFPGTPIKSPASLGTSTVTLHLYSKNVDKMWARATQAGAIIVMPLDNQFWGDRYGQLVDPFGHHWSLAQHIKMSAKEMEERQKAAMAMFSAGEHMGHLETPPGGVA